MAKGVFLQQYVTYLLFLWIRFSHSTTDYESSVSLGPPCPLDWNSAPCECSGHSKAPTIDCSLAEKPDQLTQVFHTLAQGIAFASFKLYQSNLSSLPSNLFISSNFSTFVINEANINVIPEDLFKSSKNTVITITISKTKIIEFPFKALSNFPTLETLILTENQLNKIPAEAFGENGPSNLQELNLHGNKIMSIESYAFSNLPFLHKLDLSENSLKSLGPQAFSMRNHKETLLLSLAKNTIAEITKYAFSGLVFSSIHLEYNQLRTLPQDVFEPLLEYMDRSDSTLYVTGNPFTCNMTLQWLVSKNQPMKQHIRDLVCPDGKTLETITINDLIAMSKESPRQQ